MKRKSLVKYNRCDIHGMATDGKNIQINRMHKFAMSSGILRRRRECHRSIYIV